MKTICSLSLLLAWCASAGAQTTPPAKKMRDAVTHDQLSLTMRKTSQVDPMRNLAPSKGNDPSLVNQPKDLVASSDIISFGGNATLVPKRAILSLPKNFADRIKFQPGSKIMSWMDFYTLNRGWITTVEVSRVQAEGNKPMDEEISKRISKSANLVVATYQGGPISVLPLKDPAEGDKAAATTQTPKVK